METGQTPAGVRGALELALIALDEVEWIGPRGLRACPWCGEAEWPLEAHHPGCVREAAIAAIREALSRAEGGSGGA
jgi:hypothetical protein